jgi:M6 family metalloprotease-like protein/LPXTG-motif cell wall-anchored protein
MVNWKKVLGTSLLSAGLVFSSFSPAALANSSSNVAPNVKVSAPTVHNHDEASLPFLGHTGGPFDLGMVNKDKLLASLVKQGVISKNASHESQQKQLQKYLEKRVASANDVVASEPSIKDVRSEMQEDAGLAQKAAKPEKATADGWDGEVTTDEILVLLIQFPDYANSEITEADGPVLLYDQYTKEHYEQMVFGEESFDGPNGEKLISMREFYEQQSGGSYTIQGQVSDWYTASQPAAYYGANDAGGNDANPRALTEEALALAAQDPSINLANFDKEDLYDLDGDGNYREPDGIIDHLMIVHAGTGEEAGGGAVVGEDAIWSHSWNLAAPTPIPGTEGEAAVPYWGGSLVGYDYTVQPEDGATGVFAHEYGHDLGLPDEYDSAYTGAGAPTEYWTLMSSGSWAGKINGTEPTGFSPDNKLDLQKRMPGSNWFEPVEYSLDDLKASDKEVTLDQASIKGTNTDAVKVNLPDKITVVSEPTSGEYQYFSGKDSNATTTLSTTVDLTGATSAEFTFQANVDIEEHWDYAAVEVNDGTDWVSIPGNITSTDNPNGQNPGNGITGDSGGYVDAIFDLSAYVGKEIDLRIVYYTDPYVAMPGLYVDDLAVSVDGVVVVSDDAESETSDFVFDGFTKTDGKVTSTHYYLIEWRNWTAADVALGNTTRGDGTVLTHDPGMVVWYVDDYYGDNWTGEHPGDGFIGVVDAHQATATWTDNGEAAATRYQIQDAAFSLNATDEMFLDYGFAYGEGVGMALAAQPAEPTFNDANDYSNPGLVDAGRNVPAYGLEISVTNQAADMSTGDIFLSYDERTPTLKVVGAEADAYSDQDGHNEVELLVTANDGNLGEEVTVLTELVNSTDQTVLYSSEETFVSDRTEKTFDAGFTLPTDLTSGEYIVKVTATDELRNDVDTLLVLTVDNDAPTVDVENEENTEASQEAAVTVNLADADPETLEFVWSQSTEAPAEGWASFVNGETLTLSGENGTWYLHVRAQDTVGNEINWTSSAFTVDNTAPVIELNGDNPFELEEGSEFVDPGFTATDNVDGDVTSEVTVTSAVDINTVGEYVVTYTVTDEAGNQSTVTRTVKVVEKATDGEGTGTEGEGKGDGEGNLPDTATNMFNFLLSGFITLAIGVMLFVAQKRKKILA